MNPQLRDALAIDRTSLANERTALSYGRTALGCIGLAVFIFKFGDSVIGVIFGSLSLAAAVGVIYLGVRSYRNIADRIHAGGLEHLSPAEELELAVEDD